MKRRQFRTIDLRKSSLIRDPEDYYAVDLAMLDKKDEYFEEINWNINRQRKHGIKPDEIQHDMFYDIDW